MAEYFKGRAICQMYIHKYQIRKEPLIQEVKGGFDAIRHAYHRCIRFHLLEHIDEAGGRRFFIFNYKYFHNGNSVMIGILTVKVFCSLRISIFTLLRYWYRVTRLVNPKPVDSVEF